MSAAIPYKKKVKQVPAMVNLPVVTLPTEVAQPVQPAEKPHLPVKRSVGRPRKT